MPSGHILQTLWIPKKVCVLMSTFLVWSVGRFFSFFLCIRKKVMSTKRESRIPLSCSCFYRNEKENAGLENGEKYYAVVDSTMRECQSCKLSFTPSFYFAISLLSSVTKEVRLQCTSVSLSVCLSGRIRPFCLWHFAVLIFS